MPRFEALVAVIINFDSDGIEDYSSFVAALDLGDIRLKPKKLEFDMKHCVSLVAKQSI